MEQPFEEKVVAEESVVVTKRGRKPKEESVEVEAVEETVNPNYQVSATDLIATLYTYAPSPVKKGNFNGKGKCVICGVPTAAAERKICWECINKHRDELTVI
jgi:hypothetical protein